MVFKRIPNKPGMCNKTEEIMFFEGEEEADVVGRTCHQTVPDVGGEGDVSKDLVRRKTHSIVTIPDV